MHQMHQNSSKNKIKQTIQPTSPSLKGFLFKNKKHLNSVSSYLALSINILKQIQVGSQDAFHGIQSFQAPNNKVLQNI